MSDLDLDDVAHPATAGRDAAAPGHEESTRVNASHTPPPKVEPKAVQESREKPVSEPGGFANDPPDPTNPNEAIERHRRQLRP